MTSLDKEILDAWAKLTAEEKEKILKKIKERGKNKEER
jgi:predicted Fe-S protein YdhL (DUF1289 family)